MAVERLKTCDNIVALAAGTGRASTCFCTTGGIDWILWTWVTKQSPENSRESTLRKEVSQLKRAAGGENHGGGFFQRCLAKFEARRRSGNSWREAIYDQIRK